MLDLCLTCALTALYELCAVLLTLLMKKQAALKAMKARRADSTLDDKIRKTVAKSEVLMKRLNDANGYVKAQVAEAAKGNGGISAEILNKSVAVMRKVEAKAAAAQADAADIVKKAQEKAQDWSAAYTKTAQDKAAAIIKEAEAREAAAAALFKDAESMHAAVIARCSQDFETSKAKAAALIADAEARAASIIALCSQGFNPAAAVAAAADTPATKRARKE